MKLKEAAQKLDDGIEEILIYMNLPYKHWDRIRTNNNVESIRLYSSVGARIYMIQC